ncbi:MAG: hypothetical protein HY092_00435 [Candidatus Kerfeldbacteria bacterium]|nr:hypothetical protein [Candidatus Kerfeldbacteria bacterium]
MNRKKTEVPLERTLHETIETAKATARDFQIVLSLGALDFLPLLLKLHEAGHIHICQMHRVTLQSVVDKGSWGADSVALQNRTVAISPVGKTDARCLDGLIGEIESFTLL